MQRCSNSSCGYAVKGLLKLQPSLIQNQNVVNKNHVSIIVIITTWVWKMHENFTICDGRTTQIIFTVFFYIYFYLLNICEGFMDTWSFFFFFETWHHQVLHAILNVVYWSWISYPGLCLVFKNNIALYVSSVLMYGMSH